MGPKAKAVIVASGVKTFEELECWKEARSLVRMVYQAAQLSSFSKDFGLRDQIQRAAVSVMANVAEGLDAYGNTEFARFLGYANRSCSEVRSHLYVALDAGYIGQEVFKETTDQAQKTAAKVRALIAYLRTKL